MIKKYFSGLKFGLLLQIAVGPMCLMVFNTAKNVGLVSATLIFLSMVTILGTILSQFIPDNISNILNVLVGILIIFFGVKMLVKKEDNSDDEPSI